MTEVEENSALTEYCTSASARDGSRRSRRRYGALFPGANRDTRTAATKAGRSVSSSTGWSTSLTRRRVFFWNSAHMRAKA